MTRFFSRIQLKVLEPPLHPTLHSLCILARTLNVVFSQVKKVFFSVYLKETGFGYGIGMHMFFIIQAEPEYI